VGVEPQVQQLLDSPKLFGPTSQRVVEDAAAVLRAAAG
jgi:hypothetical protein